MHDDCVRHTRCGAGGRLFDRSGADSGDVDRYRVGLSGRLGRQRHYAADRWPAGLSNTHPGAGHCRSVGAIDGQRAYGDRHRQRAEFCAVRTRRGAGFARSRLYSGGPGDRHAQMAYSARPDPKPPDAGHARLWLIEGIGRGYHREFAEFSWSWRATAEPERKQQDQQDHEPEVRNGNAGKRQ